MTQPLQKPQKEKGKMENGLLRGLSTPVWAGIGGALTLLGLVFSWYFFIAQKSEKALQYQILSQGPLIDIKDNIGGKLRVMLDGKSAQNLNLLVVQLSNSGNVPIVRSDFESPITINFGPNSKIYSATVQRKQPTYLPVDLQYQPTKVQVSPLLLNPGDTMALKFLVQSPTPLVSVQSRIAGINEVQRIEPPVKGSSSVSIWLPLLDLMLLFAYLYLIIDSSRKWKEGKEFTKEARDVLNSTNERLETTTLLCKEAISDAGTLIKLSKSTVELFKSTIADVAQFAEAEKSHQLAAVLVGYEQLESSIAEAEKSHQLAVDQVEQAERLINKTDGPLA